MVVSKALYSRNEQLLKVQIPTSSCETTQMISAMYYLDYVPQVQADPGIRTPRESQWERLKMGPTT